MKNFNNFYQYKIHNSRKSLGFFGILFWGLALLICLASTSLQAQSVTRTITVGNTPLGIAVSPDGSTTYVANYFDDSISVIRNGVVADTISLPSVVFPPPSWPTPVGLLVSRDGSKLYVTYSAEASISIIDLNTKLLLNSFFAGNEPQFPAMSPDGRKIYVPSSSDGFVAVYSALTDSPTGAITVGNKPNAVAFSPDGSKAYVTNTDDNT